MIATADMLRVYARAELGGDGYPPEWHAEIKHVVRADAGHRCERCSHPYRNGEHESGEWSACDGLCSHDRRGVDDSSDRPLARWRILTVHHLNGDKADCRWWNLAALCQRCHLTIQGRVVMDRAFIFEHSDWMKPHAAGFYADKYLGEQIDRVETLARLDDLLSLERLA